MLCWGHGWSLHNQDGAQAISDIVNEITKSIDHFHLHKAMYSAEGYLPKIEQVNGVQDEKLQPTMLKRPSESTTSNLQLPSFLVS